MITPLLINMKAKATYTPTGEMKTQAQQGLNLRKEYGRGGTAVGIARARDIVNGKNLPIETVARMYSFFSRHAVDKQGKGWNSSDKEYPSNGIIAHFLWGGDPGFEWSKTIWSKYKEDNKSLLELDSIIFELEDENIIKTIINGLLNDE